MVSKIYAIGTAKIEVGVYGGSPDETKGFIMSILNKNGLIGESSIKEDGSIRITIPGLERVNREALVDVLYILANVEDLHGDAPDTYIITPSCDIPEGEYVKTGSYND